MALRNLPVLNDTEENILAWRRSIQDAIRAMGIYSGATLPAVGAPGAPVGSIYRRLGGPAGPRLYVLEDAGWVAK